jgi:hypothetical protein
MSLLDRIVNSSIAENSTNRKLHDMAYSSINGDRQEPQQQPEGVVMLGQLGRQKPMTSITKEMIKEYQQRENELNTAPNIVKGVPMKYKSVGYDLTLKPVKDTSVLVSDSQELIGDRVYVSGDIQKLGQAIKDTSENIKKIKNDIDEKGSNFGNLQVLYKEASKLETLEKQLKEKTKLYEYIDETLKSNELKKKDIERENAITAQDNKAVLSVYERELNQANRNRLNLQQQPNESEADYYQRLKELQTERYDPVLYRQRAITQNTTELKEKLGDLFKDASFKEDILKLLSDEDKFLLNKFFDKVGKSFLDQYGFNNKTLNSKMASKDLSNKLKLLQGNALATLQSAFKRNTQSEIYRDAILLERDKEASLARRAEEDLIRDRFRREQERGVRRDERIEARELLDRTLSQGQEQFKALKTLQSALAREQAQSQMGRQIQASPSLQSVLKRGLAQSQLGRQKQASTTLQSALRRRQQQEIYKDDILDERDRQDFETAKEEELARRQIGAVAKRTLQPQLADYKTSAEILQSASRQKQAQAKYGKQLQSATKIQRFYRDKIAYDKEQEKALREQAGKMISSNPQEEEARTRLKLGFFDNRSSAGETTLSNLTTPVFSRTPSVIGRIRKTRSDVGVARKPYTYDPLKPVGRPKKPRNPVGRPRKIKEGDGIRKKIYKRKPQMVSKDEKMKNRLRLVASQIEAGNTNPKLIVEVNQLYKKLYDIDNAYMYLNKKK